MEKTNKLFLMQVHPENTEQVFMDIMEKSDVERGLCRRTNIGIDTFKEIKELARRGYHFVGMVIEEGSFTTEFLFQRHPKQTEAHKLAEMKTPDELKYKL